MSRPQLRDGLGDYRVTIKATGSTPETVDMADDLGLDETYWLYGKVWLVQKQGSDGTVKDAVGMDVAIDSDDGTVTITDTNMAANDEYRLEFTTDRGTTVSS
jgi:hypothetical protein